MKLTSIYNIQIFPKPRNPSHTFIHFKLDPGLINGEKKRSKK